MFLVLGDEHRLARVHGAADSGEDGQGFLSPQVQLLRDDMGIGNDVLAVGDDEPGGKKPGWWTTRSLCGTDRDDAALYPRYRLRELPRGRRENSDISNRENYRRKLHGSKQPN